MVIQHNLTAMNSNRMLGITSKQQAKQSEQLASGYRINRAADDAAGLTISEKMRSQIRGLNRASMNAQDGVSLIQVAEGALNEAHSILQRMNQLATQAANDTNTTADRVAIQKEIDALTKELDRISSTTQYNTMNLLSGGFKAKKLQVGALANQTITISIQSLSAATLGIKAVGQGVTAQQATNIVTSNAKATAAMTTFQKALSVVSGVRSDLGAIQNRLEHTISNLDNIAENTQAAESRLRDTDMASAMVDYSKNNILAQAGQSMLAQANASKQGILTLLQ